MYQVNICDQARNELGILGGGKTFSEKGPDFLNYVEHIFPGGNASPCAPLVTSLMVILFAFNKNSQKVVEEKAV